MSKGIALYIHIPFCKQKCLYCDFPSYCGKENKMVSYAKALSKEIDTIKDKRIKTIFIGGGTPTYLSLEGWSIIKKSIDKLNKDIELEFTVEGNPGTFNEEKLKFLKDMGVNRLSIGLQAWQNKHLKSLGRIHSSEDFEKSFSLARMLGFKNINVDLMFGLPEQNIQDWKETLKKVTELHPEHLSCYSLIVEEGTKFYNLYRQNKLNLPHEDTEREMYLYTLEYLREKEYYQYEISNFSKINKECKHNLVYWNLEEYIGCGAAAHSYIDGYRYSNEVDIDNYITMMENKFSAIIEKKENSKKDDMEEFMFMGLRKIKGISVEKFNKKFKISLAEIYGDIIEKHKGNKFLIEEDGRIFLSSKGIEISNSIMSDFILDI
ncbi:radical SAM family heme chaperone HemW [Clostridium ganghwense]|uniref:Heme chaperone HemW n=1 Tax=Clostridium ganghwense TaxID=312089 RepID=A0ABT4CUC5_9CLOT|nr:radical SAM family heme chaperone HemW [Clostridium ganghwense]MCY6371831.1 radical SAM family heme chaperone HemW [Clostridium ganghwense]